MIQNEYLPRLDIGLDDNKKWGLMYSYLIQEDYKNGNKFQNRADFESLWYKLVEEFPNFAKERTKTNPVIVRINNQKSGTNISSSTKDEEISRLKQELLIAKENIRICLKKNEILQLENERLKKENELLRQNKSSKQESDSAIDQALTLLKKQESATQQLIKELEREKKGKKTVRFVEEDNSECWILDYQNSK